jgi:hypothetical protein
LEGGEQGARCVVNCLRCLASLRVERVPKIVEALAHERLNLRVEIGDGSVDALPALRPWLGGTGPGSGKLRLGALALRGADRLPAERAALKLGKRVRCRLGGLARLALLCVEMVTRIRQTGATVQHASELLPWLRARLVACESANVHARSVAPATERPAIATEGERSLARACARYTPGNRQRGCDRRPVRLR